MNHVIRKDQWRIGGVVGHGIGDGGGGWVGGGAGFGVEI